MSSAKNIAPSANRNKGVIWEVLSKSVFPIVVQSSLLPEKKEGGNPRTIIRILEVAAGSGTHTEHFATELAKFLSSNDTSSNHKKPAFVWYPTDPTEEARASIACYIEDSKLNTLGVHSPLPLTLDENGIMEAETRSVLFPDGSHFSSSSTLDLITCINMIHISPWSATLGLMKTAKDHLTKDGFLYCYGPYKEGGTATESNLAFDKSLKSRNEQWGVRDLEEVTKAAELQDLELVEKIEMPANNLSLIFRRRSNIL